MYFYDKTGLTEYVTVKLDPDEVCTQKNQTEDVNDIKSFDLPLLNNVYTDYFERNPQVSRMRLNASRVRGDIDSSMKESESIFYNIEEFEIIGEDEKYTPSKMKLVEHKKVRVEPRVFESVKKQPSVRPVKKVFDLPIINAVHNDWIEKKLLEKNLQAVKLG